MTNAKGHAAHTRADDRRTAEDQTADSAYIAGRRAVAEALRAGRPLDCVWVARGERGGSLPALLTSCRQQGVPIKEADARKLEQMVGLHHQGIVAAVACQAYATLDDMFAAAQAKDEPPLFIVADGLQDPHNVGAILRTAEAAGAHGLILPKRRSVGLTPTVYKASAGAAAYVPVARVANLVDALRELKRRGVWIYGLDMAGAPWCEAALDGPTALVVGAEGEGMSRLIREQCDFLLSLPMKGQIASLNASVACGIVLYEAARQRDGRVRAGQQ